MLKEGREIDKYTDYVKKALDKIDPSNYEVVRTHLPDYEMPKRLTRQSDGLSFVPDITAESDEGKSYFEIANKTEKERTLVGKWQLLSTLAAMKKGVFKIFVPHGHMRFTRDIVDEYDINASLVKI